jgi:hypothetical protein
LFTVDEQEDRAREVFSPKAEREALLAEFVKEKSKKG